MAKQFHKLPSEILRINDEYTAYCFDEACSNIIARIMEGETPQYVKPGMSKEDKKHFSKMSDFYKSLERG